LAARRQTVNIARVSNTGNSPSVPKPSTVTIGTIASVAASPIHLVMRPVRKNCVNSVSDCAANSSWASTAVRAARVG